MFFNSKIFDFVNPGITGVLVETGRELPEAKKVTSEVADQTFTEAILEGGVPLQLMLAFFEDSEPSFPVSDRDQT
ncbi:hypothetical protein OS190_15330 [Sulfitobacter sp. F26204]|uniref:hypothetical protein n=1 Tax=Sulfitobacter sp. F26204 TaxID=2996014 RepID=UPI00225DE62C|nr:hypothetical protein [Sulfitobacter sp. F26204]MCX7560940.1 hypothetical protein [Sulfitobacter sp. F26204]